MNNDRVITVDLDDLGKLVHDGKDIALAPAAEKALLDLIELEERVKGAMAEAKRAIEEVALGYNPNFTSVQASRIKVGYQAFGGKYAVDEVKASKIPKGLCEKVEKITYKIDSKAVDNYIKDAGSVPIGIIEKERTKSIVIKKLKDFVEVE